MADDREPSLLEQYDDAVADEDRPRLEKVLAEAAPEQLREALAAIYSRDIDDYDRSELREQLVEAWIHGVKSLADFSDEELVGELISLAGIDDWEKEEE